MKLCAAFEKLLYWEVRLIAFRVPLADTVNGSNLIVFNMQIKGDEYMQRTCPQVS